MIVMSVQAVYQIMKLIVIRIVMVTVSVKRSMMIVIFVQVVCQDM